MASPTLQFAQGTRTLLVPRQETTDTKKDPNNTNSASQLLSTLAPVAIVAIVWLLVFLFLRRKIPRRYSPRSFLSYLHSSARSPQLPTGLFNWISAFFSIPDTHVLAHHSLDGYLFLRLLKMGTVTCFVGCLITFPVLLPINITGKGGKEQLDILTMANVADNYYKYFAHAGCAWLFFGFIIFMITRESIFYINLRQAFLMSPLYARRISSRTVLFTSVPEQYLNETKLRDMLGRSVVRIWFPTDTKELDDMVSERDKISLKLEGAETKLCKLAHVAKVKSGGPADADAPIRPEDGGESGSVAARWIKPKDRPTHRLKPLIGKKVDTINWSRNELQQLIPKIEAEQAKHKAAQAKILNSVFVEFDSVSEAQAAYQSLTHHQALHMAPRYTGLNPEEVVWSNLRIKWWERVIRVFATTAFVVALIVFWSIPVAAVGAISNLDKLANEQSWLSWINEIPKEIRGVLTGLFPVICLAVLMALLPIVLRKMAELSGDPTRSAIELTVQHSYFGFQIVQVFLVATLGSAATASIQKIIDNPTSVTTLLSSQIPLSSNFYLCYFILQGLGVVASLLVGLVGLIISKVLSFLLDKTPRKLYKRWTQLAGLGWGTVFPIYTNLWIIAICYACIAPLVLLFAGLALWFFWFAYRYNLLFVYDVNVDTKGIVYPRALQHLFVGLYIAEICLIGLFALQAPRGGLGPMIMMIIFLIFTALYNLSLNSALKPLLNYLPKSLEAEERHLLAEEGNIDHSAAPRDSDLTHAASGHPVTKEASGSPDSRARPAPHSKPGILTKFLRPDIYTDYATMRRLVPSTFGNIEPEPEVANEAYFPPSVKSRPMLLWIPRDSAGVSQQEVRDTSKVIPMTDEGATFNEKGKIVWDTDGPMAPIHEEKIYW